MKGSASSIDLSTCDSAAKCITPFGLNSFITNCSEQALEKAKNFDKNPK